MFMLKDKIKKIAFVLSSLAIALGVAVAPAALADSGRSRGDDRLRFDDRVRFEDNIRRNDIVRNFGVRFADRFGFEDRFLRNDDGFRVRFEKRMDNIMIGVRSFFFDDHGSRSGRR